MIYNLVIIQYLHDLGVGRGDVLKQFYSYFTYLHGLGTGKIK